jgi:hypothetical protein
VFHYHCACVLLDVRLQAVAMEFQTLRECKAIVLRTRHAASISVSANFNECLTQILPAHPK